MTIDHNVVETENYINDQMEQAEAACYDTAIRNGHTVAVAELCDDGSVGCPDCPFMKRANSPTPAEKGCVRSQGSEKGVSPAVGEGRE